MLGMDGFAGFAGIDGSDGSAGFSGLFKAGIRGINEEIVLASILST